MSAHVQQIGLGEIAVCWSCYPSHGPYVLVGDCYQGVSADINAPSSDRALKEDTEATSCGVVHCVHSSRQPMFAFPRQSGEISNLTVGTSTGSPDICINAGVFLPPCVPSFTRWSNLRHPKNQQAGQLSVCYNHHLPTPTVSTKAT